MVSEVAPKGPRFRAGFERWNRKLHFYAGLFLLFFMWLFAFSGLILNHPTWSFAESWNNRKERNYDREMTVPGPEVKGDLGQAREILRQLGIEGEILWTTTRINAGLFDFQVRRPGHFYFIKADFAQKHVCVRQSDVNLWGVIKVLHTFSGVLDDPPNTRDWVLTYVWAFSMDAVAAGLIFMVLSSLYMWFKLPQKRLAGAAALGLGTLSCALFCIGLRWLF
ncbi:MAG: hypothetical protein AUG74_00805 [Bacteroidetes bacterium 13_1_20CM_4_60_6]|nr:MAG: hypothetical protein AUG74_00805 [Bacteroidetes bacterium 13_1_20CM_4_60_6]